jgi:wobble nucleotide-excising tRNase
MNKTQLFEQLEELGFECNRNAAYSRAMLIQIYDRLDSDADLFTEQNVGLVLRNDNLKKIRIEHDDLKIKHRVLDARHDNLKIEICDLQDKQVETINNHIKLADEHIALQNKYNKLHDTHTKTEVCHMKTHKLLDEASAALVGASERFEAYDKHIEMLNAETKEIRREFRIHRKKTKQIEKKATNPPKVIYSNAAPDCKPPEYDFN